MASKVNCHLKRHNLEFSSYATEKDTWRLYTWYVGFSLAPIWGSNG